MRFFSAALFSTLLLTASAFTIGARKGGDDNSGKGSSGSGSGGSGGGGSGKDGSGGGGSGSGGSGSGGSGSGGSGNGGSGGGGSGGKNPQCSKYYPLRDKIMKDVFHGRCNDLAKSAVRMSFHDAAPFSLALKAQGLPNGAADGSLLFDTTEVKRPDNAGLETIVATLRPFATQFGVSYGDVLHLAGYLAVVACPGGPVVRSWMGRGAIKNPHPDGLLPSPLSDVPVLVARFADMGLDTRDFMALIGSHTSGKQRHFKPAQAGSTFDTTGDVWDVRFYSETKANQTAPGVVRLPSDVKFGTHPLTAKDYDDFVGFGRQSNWASKYADAHEKMSLVGLDKNTLVDCTELIPAAIDLEKLIKVSGGEKGDPAIPPAAIESAIQSTRAPWL